MNNVKTIFQTQGEGVQSILNVDLGVNLVAIDNKVYLVHCGDLPQSMLATTSATTTLPTTINTSTDSNIVISYPNGGEIIQMGTAITIQWSSPLSINEAVSIELYKSGSLYQTLASNVSNSGSFNWNIPINIDISSNYQIRITRLTAGTPSVQDVDTSNSDFSLVMIVPTTTTTTTSTSPQLILPNTSNCRGIPILELPENEYVTCMLKDELSGRFLFATSMGRILTSGIATVNAYLTGNRRVYAEVSDGFGNVSDIAWTPIFYALYDKIVQVNKEKEIVKWKFEVMPTAILTERITATFLSPILVVKQDLGFWKDLIWTENKPDDTDLVICVRSSNSIDELRSMAWDHCFASNDTDVGNLITRSLDDMAMDGKYIQFRVMMTTDIANVTPSVINLTITYSTKFAVYFFTTKFSLLNKSNLKSGLLVADITEPQNTEVKFGISGINSADWEDYTIIEPDKFFALDNLDNVKVGIKMIAYDQTHIPEVAEFSVMSGGDKLNIMSV